MPVQSTYPQNPPIGQAGSQAEYRGAVDKVSRLAGVAGVVPGLLCMQGSGQRLNPNTSGVVSFNGASPGTVIPLPATGGSTTTPMPDSAWTGVALFQDTLEPLLNGVYAQGDSVPVLKRGPVFVNATEAVVQGADVYVYTTGVAGTDPANGSFCAGTHSGKAVLFPRGRWESSTTGAGVAILMLTP